MLYNPYNFFTSLLYVSLSNLVACFLFSFFISDWKTFITSLAFAKKVALCFTVNPLVFGFLITFKGSTALPFL